MVLLLVSTHQSLPSWAMTSLKVQVRCGRGLLTSLVTQTPVRDEKQCSEALSLPIGQRRPTTMKLAPSGAAMTPNRAKPGAGSGTRWDVQEAASRTKQQTSVAALLLALELDAVGCGVGVTVRKRLAERMRGCLMTLLVPRRASGGDAGGDGEEAEARRVDELEEEVAVPGVDAQHGAEDDPRIRFIRGRRRRHGCWLVVVTGPLV